MWQRLSYNNNDADECPFFSGFIFVKSEKINLHISGYIFLQDVEKCVICKITNMCPYALKMYYYAGFKFTCPNH